LLLRRGMNRTSRLAVVCALALGGGCSHTMSPPAHVLGAESAAPVKPGETVLGVRGGAVGEILGSSVVASSGGVRHGVAPNVELNGEATYARVDPNGADVADGDRNAVAAHVGVKAGSDVVSLVGGMGGGVVGATGGFLASDAGFIISAPNCFVVPFFSTTGFVSLPVGARTVTFSNGDTSRPGTTFGFGGGLGIEIPLNRSVCREGRTPPRLQLGANGYQAWSFDEWSDGTNGSRSSSSPSDHGGLGFTVGVEFPL
jgi:hypothetical protein